MPEISYRELEKHLKTSSALDQVILVFGDSCLSDSVVESVLTHVFKGKKPGINYEKADGLSAASVGSSLEFIMTKSFFAGPKLVCISDAKIFESKEDASSILIKSNQAFDKDDIKKASRLFLRYLAETGTELGSINSSNIEEKLGIQGDFSWVHQITGYIRDNSISFEDASSDSAIIEKTIQKGLPKNHYLVLVCDSVDKRKTGYKSFLSGNLVINCQIPKGDRKADRDAQDVIYREKASDVLKPLNKSIDPQAFMALRDLTGDDLRVFSENLKLLADFSGDRQKITREDVTSVLARTKTDPIYEFTNSLSARDLESSLFYFRSIIDSGAHPLQVLASMINLFRRLLILRSFCDGSGGRTWRNGMSYNEFQNTVMQAVSAEDSRLTELVSSWQPMTTNIKAKKTAAVKTDLLIAKGASPYPVYLLFQKASGFIIGELLKIYEDLSLLDIKMKSSGGDNVLMIESLIIKICTKANY